MKAIIHKIMKLLCCTFIFVLLSGVLISCGTRDREDGLMLHLKFDEKSGKTATDSSGKNAAAEIQYVFNNAAFKRSADPVRRRGVFGTAQSFDGFSNFIEYRDYKLSEDNFSISVWVAPRAWEYADGSITAIVNQYDPQNESGFILGFRDYGTITFRLGLDGIGMVELTDGGDTLDKFVWTHLTAAYDNGTGVMTLYKNGQPINSRRVGAGYKIKACAEPLIIGKNLFGGFSSGIINSVNMFGGLMDELKLYDRALTAPEVLKEYTDGTVNGVHPQCRFEDVWLDATVLADDRYRPQFHAAPPQNWMNEAIAPFFYNGKYHMFYQQTPNGPYLRNSHWGHWISDDMVRWKNVAPALAPEPNGIDNHHVFSGGAVVDSSGVPHLFYTGVNFGLSHLNRISVATPKNLNDPELTEWVKTGTPVIEQPDDCSIVDFRDPYIYQDGNDVYMLVGTSSAVGNFRDGNPRIVIYRASADNLLQWDYLGVMFEKSFRDYPNMGYMWELPVFYKLKSENGTQKYMLAVSPKPDPQMPDVINDMYYFLGEFDKMTGKFIAENETPLRLDFGGNVAAGPTGFTDPNSGKNVLWSIAQDQRTGNDVKDSGWANTATIAKEIGLNDDGSLSIQPLSAYESLHGKQLASFENKSIGEANTLLKDARGDMLHIKLTMKLNGATEMGIKLRKSGDGREETVYFYNDIYQTVYVNTFKSGIGQMTINESGGELIAADGKITFDIYLDRSLIEGFVNGRMCLSAKVFPVLKDSLGIEVYSDGDARVESMRVFEMKDMYGHGIPSYYEG